MSDFRRLDDSTLASPQITPQDVATSSELGIALIINNRPEGEAEDQTPGSVIEAAAAEAGIGYRAIPISPSGFSEGQVEEMAEALAGAGGAVLAYCRSGTRSTFLWALCKAKSGMDPAAISALAAKAGYDISPIAPALEMYAARASE